MESDILELSQEDIITMDDAITRMGRSLYQDMEELKNSGEFVQPDFSVPGIESLSPATQQELTAHFQKLKVSNIIKKYNEALDAIEQGTPTRQDYARAFYWMTCKANLEGIAPR